MHQFRFGHTQSLVQVLAQKSRPGLVIRSGVSMCLATESAPCLAKSILSLLLSPLCSTHHPFPLTPSVLAYLSQQIFDCLLSQGRQLQSSFQWACNRQWWRLFCKCQKSASAQAMIVIPAAIGNRIELSVLLQ